jgi:hypothetical protein
MPYKVDKHIKKGSKVRIRSKRWYDRHKDFNGMVTSVPFHFIEDMAQYCGKEATVVAVGQKNCGGWRPSYDLDIDGGSYNWSAEMFVVPRKHNLHRL